MDKKLAVLVDTDEEYIAALEYKLLEEWQEDVDIHVISQLKYFNEFFSQPRTMDILIINEYLYSEKVRKQNCGCVFILKEDDTNLHLGAGPMELSKYSSIKEIYAQIMRVVRMSAPHKDIERTRMYMVYSPVGGCGKTVCALGLSGQLSQFEKKVLYINLESIQDFNEYLEDKQWASPGFCYGLGGRRPDISREALQEVGSCGFDFLRPMEKSPVTYQVTDERLFDLARHIQDEKLYDIIVIEVSGEFTAKKAEWMEQMDKVFIIAMNDSHSIEKLRSFLKNIVYSSEKYLFICNRVLREQDNYRNPLLSMGEISVCEYIEEQEGGMSLEKIMDRGILRKTAYALE